MKSFEEARTRKWLVLLYDATNRLKHYSSINTLSRVNSFEWSLMHRYKFSSMTCMLQCLWRQPSTRINQLTLERRVVLLADVIKFFNTACTSFSAFMSGNQRAMTVLESRRFLVAFCCTEHMRTLWTLVVQTSFTGLKARTNLNKISNVKAVAQIMKNNIFILKRRSTFSILFLPASTLTCSLSHPRAMPCAPPTCWNIQQIFFRSSPFHSFCKSMQTGWLLVANVCERDGLC